MKVATAFSGGFGSVEFALKYLNIKHEVVFACEWMKPQRESYILNHGEPTSNFYEDICNLDGNKYKGEIDYYHLSPPCQEYSMAGNRGGADTDKGQLMFQAIKSIDEVQPKMFSVENVRGLLSSNGGEDWKNILKDFKSLKGYTISWGIMNAKEQGTPQNRERVFIVGFRGTGAKMSFPKRVPLQYVLKDLLEDEVDEKYFLSEKTIKMFNAHKERHDNAGNGFGMTPKTRETKIAGAISCKAGSRATDNYIEEKLNQVGNIDTKGHNSLWGRVYSPDGIAPTQNAKGGGAGAKTGLFKIASNTKSGYEVATDGDGISLSRPSSTTRRGRVGKQVSQTLDTSSSQGVLEKSNIRRLTPREVSRVQGDFKDMFKFGKASDTKLYEFIGNAMDVNTTKNLIVRMIDHLKNVKLIDAQESSFKVSVKDKQLDLFDMEVA